MVRTCQEVSWVEVWCYFTQWGQNRTLGEHLEEGKNKPAKYLDKPVAAQNADGLIICLCLVKCWFFIIFCYQMTDLKEAYSKKNTYLIWKKSCREECIFAGLHNKRANHFSFLPDFKDRKLSFCHERLFLLTQLVV